MTGDKKWFSSLTPLSHKEYVTFGDDKKGKVLGNGAIKVTDYFTFNDIALVDKLRYNILSVSQLVDADFDVLFLKSDSQVLDSSGKRVYDISCIGKVFQADFPLAQSSVKRLISQFSFELWKWHRRLDYLDSTYYVNSVTLAFSENCCCLSLGVTLFVLPVIMAR
jgi:hypothetical protein